MMALYAKIHRDLELYLPLWFPGKKFFFNFLFNNNSKKIRGDLELSFPLWFPGKKIFFPISYLITTTPQKLQF